MGQRGILGGGGAGQAEEQRPFHCWSVHPLSEDGDDFAPVETYERRETRRNNSSSFGP